MTIIVHFEIAEGEAHGICVDKHALDQYGFVEEDPYESVEFLPGAFGPVTLPSGAVLMVRELEADDGDE